MQLYTVYFICKLLYTFRVVSPSIIRTTNNCIYSIWYWSTIKIKIIIYLNLYVIYNQIQSLTRYF